MSTRITTRLSPRHERFVLEFLKDGNATQAYVRAGYSPRGAQPSASRLLRDPRIEAAIAAGRARMAQALEVDVTRLARECARIAFASIEDFISIDETGHPRIDLMKATQAQCAAIVELKVSNHGKQEQTVTLKLGKLQALSMLTRQVGLRVGEGRNNAGQPYVNFLPPRRKVDKGEP
ncbi:MAG: terminase small subunit [Alphaproteobacteria bacterium]|nr:terminase small subunit [Alphaproteobacteria bacterium]MCW5744126.1 terminase small subunit [Alphaproteobacteria bacterium]